MKNFTNQTFFVFGLGRSGKATLDFLLKKGVKTIYAWDDSEESIETNKKHYKNSKIDFISYNDIDWSKIDILAPASSTSLPSSQIFSAIKSHLQQCCYYVILPSANVIIRPALCAILSSCVTITIV